MPNDPREDLIEALGRILDAERRALIQGDYDTLTGLQDHKEALLGKISDRGPNDAAELTGLRRKLRHNHHLMESALQGIHGVAARISELRTVREALATYDRDGRRRDIATAPPRKLERRA